MTKKGPAPATVRIKFQKLIETIPDSPENLARGILTTPPGEVSPFGDDAGDALLVRPVPSSITRSIFSSNRPAGRSNPTPWNMKVELAPAYRVSAAKKTALPIESRGQDRTKE